MTTFKDFLSEGYLADVKAKMLLVKTELAKSLKLRRHQVETYRQVAGVEYGMKWLVRAPVPAGRDTEFFISMFKKLISRELGKYFTSWQVGDSFDYHENGQYLAAVTVFVPDADGMLP